MARYIIGVHSGHDASACLLRDNRIVFAIEKERLTRKKHDSGDPVECIDYLLESEGLLPHQIDLVVRNNWFDATSLKDEYYLRFPNVVVNKNHHLFHAYANSLMIPPNEDVLIWVIDGRGCRPEDAGYYGCGKNLFEAESIYRIQGNHIETVEKRFAIHYPKAFSWGSHMDTMGYAFAAISKIIFHDVNAAGKIMALASFGKYNPIIPRVISKGDNMLINKQWIHFLQALDIPLEWDTDMAKDLSYSIQYALETYSINRIHALIEKYSIRKIGVSGGIALNCKNNCKIANLKDVERLYLFPASGDNGLSIGGAVWAMRKVFKDYASIQWDYGLGRQYENTFFSNGDIEKAVDFLIKGAVVGIFEGGSEFGPRALCHRSLITRADDIRLKTTLNVKIKQREIFRPFGGIILRKNLSCVTSDILPSDYMLSAVRMNDDALKQYPALIHKDNTVRLQVIEDEQSSAYKILDLYEKRTGKMMLINTSFNGRGEPIVETISDTLNCAKRIGVRYILINGRFVYQ